MIIDSLTMLEGVGGTSKIIGVGVKGGFLRFFFFFWGGGGGKGFSIPRSYLRSCRDLAKILQYHS